MPLLDQIWRNFSLISRTVLQQDLFFKAPHAACAVLLITGLLCDCHCHKHHVRGGGSKPKVFPELQLSKSSAENTPTIPVLPDGWLCPGKHLIFQFKWKNITPVANDLQLYKQHWPHSRNLVVSWPITAHAKTFS